MGEQQLHVTVTEKGKQKLWTIPLKDKDGNLHYLVQALADYAAGDEIVVEMKKNGAKNYVDIRRVGELKAGDELPDINLDEDGENAGGGVETLPPSEDISPEEIPF